MKRPILNFQSPFHRGSGFDILPHPKGWGFFPVPLRSRIVVSTRITSNNNDLQPLLQRTMPCPFGCLHPTVCIDIVCCRRLVSVPIPMTKIVDRITSGTCPKKGLTAWALHRLPRLFGLNRLSGSAILKSLFSELHDNPYRNEEFL